MKSFRLLSNLKIASKYFILMAIVLSFLIVAIVAAMNGLYFEKDYFYDASRSAVVIGIFLIVLDVTTLIAVIAIERNAKSEEQNYVIANQMILVGELSSLINHEFKNIITILDYPIKNLSSINVEDISQNKNIEKIQRNFNRFSELIRAFGSLGRASDLKMGSVLVSQSIKDVVYFVEWLALRKGIRFSLEERGISNENVSFYGNQTLLTQTLLNLVKNSCDAVEEIPVESRWVSLIIHTSKDKVRFQVIDAGKGLNEKVLKKLFRERITTKGSRGTGLGLNISRRFTHLQGGSLDYDVSEVNTSFSVTLRRG